MTDNATEAKIDAGLADILAKDDTAIMLDELREIFGADIDVDSRFTIAQILTAMERSFEDGKAHIEMVNRAALSATPTDTDEDGKYLRELADRLRCDASNLEGDVETDDPNREIYLRQATQLRDDADRLERIAARLGEAERAIERAYTEGHNHGRANPPVYQSAGEDWLQSRSRAALSPTQPRRS